MCVCVRVCVWVCVNLCLCVCLCMRVGVCLCVVMALGHGEEWSGAVERNQSTSGKPFTHTEFIRQGLNSNQLSLQVTTAQYRCFSVSVQIGWSSLEHCRGV